MKNAAGLTTHWRRKTLSLSFVIWPSVKPRDESSSSCYVSNSEYLIFSWWVMTYLFILMYSISEMICNDLELIYSDTSADLADTISNLFFTNLRHEIRYWVNETDIMERVDEALAKVGGYRRWHLGIFFSLGMSSFMGVCWQQLIIVFQGEYHLTCLSIRWCTT